MSTKIGHIAQEVSRLNPWWRDRSWASRDADLVEASATGIHYRPHVLDDLEPGALYLLRGPRRVGKTVAVKQRVEKLLADGATPSSVVRLAVDGWGARDLRTVIQNTALPPVPQGVSRIWFIDEVSSVSGDWAQQIKWLRDNDNEFRASTVVLTGSNAAALTEAVGTLAGRRGTAPNTDRTLFPMGFRTFVHVTAGSDTPDLPVVPLSQLRMPNARTTYADGIAWLDVLVRHWELYIQYGGFPRSVAAAAQGHPVPESFAEDLFDVVAGDAFRQSKLSVPTEMALLERLWRSIGTPANLSNIAKDLDISADVVTRHVAYLRDAYLLWQCPQRDARSWTPRQRAQDKLYAIDPLIARLAHLRNVERLDIDPTVLTEMQLGMAIRRRTAEEHPAEWNDEFLFHVRTPARKEIDFVSSSLSGVAIEAKYSEDGSWRSAAATVDASQWDGILCTRNVLDTTSAKAWAIPAGLLAFLIDT